MSYVQEQPILRSPCTGSEKLRLQSRLANSRHRDRLWCELVSPTTICLMRWMRLHSKKASQHADTLPRRVPRCRRATCQKHARFLRGRQIAYMTVHGLSDLFTLSSQNKWHAFRCDPGRIQHVEITRFCLPSDCVGFVRSRNCSKQRKSELFTIEDSCSFILIR